MYCNFFLEMRATDLLFTVAYIFEIVFKSFLTQHQNNQMCNLK